MIEFSNQVEGESVLALFCQVARRLRAVTSALPEAVPGTKLRRVPEIHGPPAPVANPDAMDLVLELSFPTIPEREFEVLALRFRPFYAENEKINFLKVLALVDQKNEDLREFTARLRDDWHHAAYWGKMKISPAGMDIDAEKVINAGFYSMYFHVEKAKLEQANEYRARLGANMFEVALISSVWNRALLVVEAAERFEAELIAQGAVSQEEADARPRVLPEIVTFSMLGKSSAFSLGPPGRPKKKAKK